MAYTNNQGGSPLTLSNNVAIYSGVATTGEGIVADIGNAARGSLYLSTSGAFFVKKETHDDANAWHKLSDASVAPELDNEVFGASMSLGASVSALINKVASATTTLVASLPLKGFEIGAALAPSASVTVNKANEAETHEASVSMGADVSILVNYA